MVLLFCHSQEWKDTCLYWSSNLPGRDQPRKGETLSSRVVTVSRTSKRLTTFWLSRYDVPSSSTCLSSNLRYLRLDFLTSSLILMKTFSRTIQIDIRDPLLSETGFQAVQGDLLSEQMIKSRSQLWIVASPSRLRFLYQLFKLRIISFFYVRTESSPEETSEYALLRSLLCKASMNPYNETIITLNHERKTIASIFRYSESSLKKVIKIHTGIWTHSWLNTTKVWEEGKERCVVFCSKQERCFCGMAFMDPSQLIWQPLADSLSAITGTYILQQTGWSSKWVIEAVTDREITTGMRMLSRLFLIIYP